MGSNLSCIAASLSLASNDAYGGGATRTTAYYDQYRWSV